MGDNRGLLGTEGFNTHFYTCVLSFLQWSQLRGHIPQRLHPVPRHEFSVRSKSMVFVYGRQIIFRRVCFFLSTETDIISIFIFYFFIFFSWGVTLSIFHLILRLFQYKESRIGPLSERQTET